MKVLVTGSAGFIGSALTIKLLDRGDEVIGVDNHLPWTLKADLKHLSAYTQKKAVIMGKIRSLRLADRYRTEKIL